MTAKEKRSAVMTIANALHKQGMSRSAAMPEQRANNEKTAVKRERTKRKNLTKLDFHTRANRERTEKNLIKPYIHTRAYEITQTDPTGAAAFSSFKGLKRRAPLVYVYVHICKT